MLNLIKYDWKKMNTLIYSFLGVTVLCQIILLLLDRKYGWWDEVTLAASFALTSMFLQVLLIIIIYQFNATLKSITRRLLPVSAVKEYFAHLILPTIYFLVFAVENFIFYLILNPKFILPEVNEFIAQQNMLSVFISLIVFTVFYSILSFMMYFMAVAITRLFKTNAKIVIFIGLVFICSIIYSIIIELINPGSSIMHQAHIRVEITQTNVLINWFKLSWTILIDLAFMAIMSFITVYIMKNKLEV